MLKKILLIVGLIVVILLVKSCIPKRTVFHGRVVDQLGYPVIHAQVIYVSNSGWMGNSKAFLVQTDNNGQFSAVTDGGWMFSIQSIKKEGYVMDLLHQSGKTALFIHADKPVEYGDWDNTTPQKPYTYVMYKKPGKSYRFLSLLYDSTFQFNRNKIFGDTPEIIYDVPAYFKFIFDKSPKYENDCRKYKENRQACTFPVKRKNSVFIWPATATDADFSVAISKLPATLKGEPDFEETLMTIKTYGVMDIQLISSKFIDKHHYESYDEHQYYYRMRDRITSPLYPYLAYKSGYEQNIQLILDSFQWRAPRFYFRYGNLYGKMAVGLTRADFQLSIRFSMNMDGGRDLYGSIEDNRNFVRSIGGSIFDFNPRR